MSPIVGSGRQPIFIDMDGILLSPFFWLYERIQRRFFKPNPMAAYALMIEQVNRTIELNRRLKKKGLTLAAIPASFLKRRYGVVP